MNELLARIHILHEFDMSIYDYVLYTLMESKGRMAKMRIKSDRYLCYRDN